MRLLRGNQLGTLTIVAVACTMLLVAAGTGAGKHERSLRPAASSWRGLVGDPRVQVAIGQRMLVVLRGPSLADRVAAGGRPSRQQARQWTASAFAAQQQLLSTLAAAGVRVRREFRYARVLNAFSAALDGRALAMLEAAPQVAGVYPVRAAYPATSAAAPAGRVALGPGGWTGATLPGFDGTGLRIALLDTGVDLGHPYLHGRVLPGVDLVDGSTTAEARARPGSTNEVERHGTELASVLVGSSSDAGLSPLVPGARVLPLRVAGWQRDATGTASVYARTDQVLAGLERAADPDADGSADDAVDVALIGVAEPYAAFSDGPLARAVDGTRRLGTVVVTAAGNDGPAASTFGNVSGPGGSPAALTVGAADLRGQAQEVRLVVRTGLQVLLDRVLPLAGSVAPVRGIRANLALPRVPEGEPSALPVDSFFDPRGFSLVAGKAALVPAGAAPEATARNAARAGAVAVVLYGANLAAGALGAPAGVTIPVVSLPLGFARSLVASIRDGSTISLVLGRTRVVRNTSSGRVAAFSSRGLSFDGRIKPDLVAPGVGIPVADPGFGDDGLPRSGTVNGSSIAAAVVAGAAALLHQARPTLGPAALKALLVGTARPRPSDPVSAQGGGLLDLGAATASELVAAPASISFGPASGSGALDPAILELRNVSTRRLVAYLSTAEAGRSAPITVGVSRTRVALAPGGVARLAVRARVNRIPASRLAQGWLVITPVGGSALRVPWAIGFASPAGSLLSGVRLSTASLEAASNSRAVLSFQAGRVVAGAGGDAIVPVSRLDVELWKLVKGKPARLGLVLRLRDLLPGRYALGLAGRDPEGKKLPAGRYRVTVTAAPTAHGQASRVGLTFRVK
jgi:hypothetical protein